jgi:diadenosine tetraphosphate (Ap4A) HIT family hydrolase
MFCAEQSSGPAPIGGIIARDDLIYATHVTEGEPPWYLGHLIVKSRRHAATVADLSDAEAQAFGLLFTRLGRALVATVAAAKLYVMLYGEVVPHVHAYLTARYPGTPEAYWRWQLTAWPDAPRGGPQEVTALCDRLRAELARNA